MATRSQFVAAIQANKNRSSLDRSRTAGTLACSFGPPVAWNSWDKSLTDRDYSLHALAARSAELRCFQNRSYVAAGHSVNTGELRGRTPAWLSSLCRNQLPGK